MLMALVLVNTAPSLGNCTVTVTSLKLPASFWVMALAVVHWFSVSHRVTVTGVRFSPGKTQLAVRPVSVWFCLPMRLSVQARSSYWRCELKTHPAIGGVS